VYAAAGQKWLCGADGTGMLYVTPAFSPAGIEISEDADHGPT
jgi:selenocysteine lyase/cysteine desulfurase